MKTKNFISNVAFLIFLNVIVKPFWVFGIDRTVQNTVGAEDYGTYFALLNFTLLFQILLDFGINQFNNRAVAQNHERLNRYLPNILLIKIGLSAIYLILCVSGAYWLQYDSFQIHLLFWLCFNQIMASFVLYFRSNLSGLHFFKKDSIVSVMDKGLMIVICGILLWASFSPSPFRIEWFVYAQTLAYFLAALGSFWMVFGVATNLQFKLDISLIRSIFKESYPYALAVLLMSIYYRVDGVMLEFMLKENGAKETGIYAAAFRLLDVVNMFALMFANVLLPMFARMLAQKEDVNSLVGLSSAVLYTFGSAGAIHCFVFSDWVMQWLYVEYTPYYGQIFAYLILSFIPISITYTFGTLLTANGSMKVFNGIALSGMLLNIGLNSWLIPTQQAFGATIATLVTQGLVGFLCLVFAIRIVELKVKWQAVLKVICYFLICWSIAYIASNLGLDWRINMVIGIFSCLVAALGIGLLKWKNIAGIIS
ncbi:MAG: oligosaccharide flippase family protein [Chitinophagales bacterium]